MLARYFYLFFILYPIIAMWWKSFPKAGRKKWEALIPGYNYAIASKIAGQKGWWAFLMLVPGIHIIMWMIFNVSYIRKHGYFSIWDTLQGVFFPYILMYKIATDKSIQPEFTTDWEIQKDLERRKYGDHLVLFLAVPVVGHIVAWVLGSLQKKSKRKKTIIKEWGDSILFALIAASIIRTYVFEPFKIPTGSMEKTLLVGDYLVVNKLTYGSRVPETPLSFPLVHNTIPWVQLQSYSTLEDVNYFRFPGFSDVHNFDVVVFNFPAGDTAVYDPRMPNGLMGHNYHSIVNSEARRLFEKSIDKNKIRSARLLMQKRRKELAEKYTGAKLDSLIALDEEKINHYVFDEVYKEFIDNFHYWQDKARYEIAVEKKTYSSSDGKVIRHKGIIYRPIDKREFYIKRCIGIPGDSLKIIDSRVYINGEKIPVFKHQNLQYHVTNISLSSKGVMRTKYGLKYGRDYHSSNNLMNLTKGELAALKEDFPKAVFSLVNPPRKNASEMSPSEKVSNIRLYPNSFKVNNTISNYQTVWIPKKGVTIAMNEHNYIWYRRTITAYEHHQLTQREGKFYLDGKEIKSYTFEKNYYWMMGDNRYNSADSRYWGFVPEDHIVGKASMVWFSKDPDFGVRWDRLFTKIE